MELGEIPGIIDALWKAINSDLRVRVSDIQGQVDKLKADPNRLSILEIRTRLDLMEKEIKAMQENKRCCHPEDPVFQDAVSRVALEARKLPPGSIIRCDTIEDVPLPFPAIAQAKRLADEKFPTKANWAQEALKKRVENLEEALSDKGEVVFLEKKVPFPSKTQ